MDLNRLKSFRIFSQNIVVVGMLLALFDLMCGSKRASAEERSELRKEIWILLLENRETPSDGASRSEVAFLRSDIVDWDNMKSVILQIVSRADSVVNGRSPSSDPLSQPLPSSQRLDLATNWVMNQVRKDSPLFKLYSERFRKSLEMAILVKEEHSSESHKSTPMVNMRSGLGSRVEHISQHRSKNMGMEKIEDNKEGSLLEEALTKFGLRGMKEEVETLKHKLSSPMLNYHLGVYSKYYSSLL
jgi:hypothetical protein